MAQTTQRPDRIPVLSEKFNPAEVDLLEYRAEGREMIMKFWPRLGSTFPVLEVRQKVKEGKNPPAVIDTPVSEADMGWIELHGQIYPVVCITFRDDYLPDLVRAADTNGSTLAAYVFDNNGKVLSSVGFIGIFGPFQVVEILRLKLDFERNSKPVEASAIKTFLNPPNIEEMTHEWSATVKAPGLPIYTVGGDVPELRRNGIKPEKYTHWKSAAVWSQTVKGKQFKHLIIEDVDGMKHTITHDENGTVLNVSKFAGAFGIVLRSADHQAQINA